MGFLSNLTPNLEKKSAFGEIASLKKHYEKFTIKKPPYIQIWGNIGGVFLIVKFCSPKMPFLDVSEESKNFGFFSSDFFP